MQLEDFPAYKNLSETSVNVKFTADVDLFRKAVKMEWNAPGYLDNTPAGAPKVYENESTFRKDESKGRLEAGDYLKSLGSSSTDPVIVVVPLIPQLSADTSEPRLLASVVQRPDSASSGRASSTYRDSWDEEDIPRELPRLENLMEDSETEFVTLPGGWLQGSGVVPPVREGSKLRVPDTMLFMRRECRNQSKFMADILENELCGIVYGQPGTGKSSAAYLMAGSLALHREDISILWVNVNKSFKLKYSCVLLEKGKCWKIELPSLASVEELLKTLWMESNDQSAKRVLLVDGYVGGDGTSAYAFALEWVLGDLNRHKVLFMSSMGGMQPLSPEAQDIVGSSGFQQTTWTFEDYLKAISNPRFRDSVLRSLSVEPSESHDTQTVTRKLKAKHHYAGGCARFMFGYTTDEVISVIEDTICEIRSPDKLAAITTAIADESLKRSLLECFRKRTTGEYSALNHRVFISDYVKDLVAKQIGVDNLIQNAILFRNNDSMLGWIFEEYFFRRVSVDEAGKKTYASTSLRNEC